MDWSAFWGAFMGTLLNLLEIGILVKILRDIRCMLKQFKTEGERDKWLR